VTPSIVLCSASPRRQQLLNALGYQFETRKKEVDESFPPELKEASVVLYLAEKKATAFNSEIVLGKIYITADTIVCLHGKVFGKPVDTNDAVAMLKELSGNAHQVYTGICLTTVEQKKSFVVRSDVQFKDLLESDIEYYVKNYQPFDKAGAYGAQECLPEGMNPCSQEEIIFLRSIHQNDLFERTLSKDKKHMPVIERIDGSYFNVMGLPVMELYFELNTLLSKK
jgi:septum formation protein